MKHAYSEDKTRLIIFKRYPTALLFNLILSVYKIWFYTTLVIEFVLHYRVSAILVM